MILAFDTETTGLPMTSKEGVVIEPYITQLSAILYNVHDNRMVSFMSSYIQLPPGVEISAKAEAISGITQEICQKKGRPIEKVLKAFYKLYSQADTLVAHNLDFDVDRICAQIRRMVEQKTADKIPLSKYCYMFSPKHMSPETQMICTMKTASNQLGNRWPKLIDLYRRLFGYTIEANRLHHSFVDSILCLRVFLKTQHHVTVPDVEFNNWLDLFSNVAPATTRKAPWRKCKKSSCLERM